MKIFRGPFQKVGHSEYVEPELRETHKARLLNPEQEGSVEPVSVTEVAQTRSLLPG